MNSRLLKIGIVLLILALLTLCVVVSSAVDRDDPDGEHPWDDLLNFEHAWQELDYQSGGIDEICFGIDPDWEHPWDDLKEHPWMHDD